MKILIVNTVSYKMNGMTNVIMQYYRAIISSEEITVDFAGISDMPLELRKEVESNSGSIYVLSDRNHNPIKYIGQLRKICLQGKYDILHAHGNSSTLLFEMFAALTGKISVRIAHGHSSSCDQKILNILLKPIFLSMYTFGFACSEDAGNFLFWHHPFKVLPNAFDISKFAYNYQDRIDIRARLQLDGKVVLGYVATLTKSKNHYFLFEILHEYIKMVPNAVLILIGKGPEEKNLRRSVIEMGIPSSVLFLGERNDVSHVVNAFDYVVFPSQYEGLGIALIEAQTNGLPVLATKDTIPSCVKLNHNFKFLPLKDPKVWAETLFGLPMQREVNGIQNVRDAGYDIYSKGEKLVTTYNELIAKN